MAGKLDFLEKMNSDKVLIGYDLGRRFSQISYLSRGSDAPETLSVVAGSESYNIPAVLCKRKSVNQWFYGKEACRYAEENEGTLVENLVDMAKDGEKVLIEGEEFDPVALLTLFIKRSLSVLSAVSGVEKIGGIMFTCGELDRRMVEVLSQAVAGMGLKTKNICFQGHVESVYYYLLHQPQELWNQQAVVCKYQEDGMKIYRMECNKRTAPVVAFIDEELYPFRSPESIPEEESLREEAWRDMDRRFLGMMEEVCGGRLISSVYLIGEGFSEDWLKDSLRYLCKNRRVFQGNNLFSKGACYSMKEKQEASEIGKNHVFLGNEKLKSNIGMKVLRRGMDSYFALLDAGVNWFEAGKEFEFFLETGNSFTVLVTPLNGRDVKAVEIVLEGLPYRPEGTTRLRLGVDMISESRVQFRIEDKGFGEIFPASHLKWKEIIEV